MWKLFLTERDGGKYMGERMTYWVTRVPLSGASGRTQRRVLNRIILQKAVEPLQITRIGMFSG